MSCQPDLEYAIFTVSRFILNPTREHMIVVKLVYRYLKAAKNIQSIYKVRLTEKLHLKMNTDADLACDKGTHKSTSRYVAILARCLIS